MAGRFRQTTRPPPHPRGHATGPRGITFSIRLSMHALTFNLVLCACGVAAGDVLPAPTVGAIRWDAWTGGPATEQVERTLGPSQYHDRLPWFAEVLDDNRVRIKGGRQEVMDREIRFAANAGLEYWAFLLYPRSNSMSTALAQYLSSPDRRHIRFCVILHNTLNASPEQWPQERERAVALLRRPEYQTVLNHRPLVYAFMGHLFPFERFAEFLTAAHDAGLNPYCVFMGWDPKADFAQVSAREFDAVSAYARGGSEACFADLAKSVEEHYWRAAAGAQVPYVPLVTTGWDKRSRKDNPVSWEQHAAYHQQDQFPSRAAPGEIAAHLQRALGFVRSHPDICIANTVIIYAWNEYDEGGWLAPTRGADGDPDTSRLDAVQRVLTYQRTTTQPADTRGQP